MRNPVGQRLGSINNAGLQAMLGICPGARCGWRLTSRQSASVTPLPPPLARSASAAAEGSRSGEVTSGAGSYRAAAASCHSAVRRRGHKGGGP